MNQIPIHWLLNRSQGSWKPNNFCHSKYCRNRVPKSNLTPILSRNLEILCSMYSGCLVDSTTNLIPCVLLDLLIKQSTRYPCCSCEIWSLTFYFPAQATWGNEWSLGRCMYVAIHYHWVIFVSRIENNSYRTRQTHHRDIFKRFHLILGAGMSPMPLRWDSFRFPEEKAFHSMFKTFPSKKSSNLWRHCQNIPILDTFSWRWKLHTKPAF